MLVICCSAWSGHNKLKQYAHLVTGFIGLPLILVVVVQLWVVVLVELVFNFFHKGNWRWPTIQVVSVVSDGDVGVVAVLCGLCQRNRAIRY